jgi:hypothetical protein
MSNIANNLYTDGPVDLIIQKNISANIQNLKLFLSSNDFITEKDQRTNLISVADGKTYCIPVDKYDDLFEKLEACRKENRMLHYSERQVTIDVSHSGIMIDLDRYQASDKPQITIHHYEKFSRMLSLILMETLDFSQYLDSMGNTTINMFYIRKPSVVAEPKKSPSDPTIYKDGLHLLIPEVQVTRGYKKFLMDELQSRDFMAKVFSDIDHSVQPASKMLDMNSASVPVHFYGHSKVGRPAYKLVAAHKCNLMFDEMLADRTALDHLGLAEGILKDGIESNPREI